MIAPGDIVSYIEMCQEEGASLQRGMNFRLKGRDSVILMSQRRGAPYMDRVEENGKVLIYEGHDVARTAQHPNPKELDQEEFLSGGNPTQNGLFFEAAMRFKNGTAPTEVVKVYEKIRDGIWAFNGFFELIDAWQERVGPRSVFKFKLAITTAASELDSQVNDPLPQNRLIPSEVKLVVWKRDGGKCVQCGSRDNLHFDHIIPFSLGGSSLTAENIQLLCARHNLQKHDRIS